MAIRMHFDSQQVSRDVVVFTVVGALAEDVKQYCHNHPDKEGMPGVVAAALMTAVEVAKAHVSHCNNQAAKYREEKAALDKKYGYA